MEEFLRIVKKAITESKANFDHIKKDVIEANKTPDLVYGSIEMEDGVSLVMLKTSHPIERYEVKISIQKQAE